MKKLLLLILLVASPLFAQVQSTNKMNNTVLLLGANSSFTYLKAPIVAGYVLTTDVNGVATWAATSGGAGDVFTTSNNTFVAGSTNTFNGETFTSNITIRGSIFQNAVVSSNLFSAASNFFTGLIRASDATVNHRIGNVVISSSSLSSATGTLNLGALSSPVAVNPLAGSIFTVNGLGMVVTNDATISNALFVSRIIQFGNASGTSNLFLAQSNYFIGMIHAPSNLAHRLAGLSLNFSTLSASGTLTLNGSTVALSPSGSGLTIANGGGLIVTNTLSVSNNFFVGQTTQLGTNGSAFVFHKTATASLDFPSILAAGSADLTITVGGAAANDSVIMGKPVDQDASLTTEAFVSAANTVTVRAHNVGTIAVDQADKTYRVTVVHY